MDYLLPQPEIAIVAGGHLAHALIVNLQSTICNLQSVQVITRTQVISDTLQPATNLFVCRVDGAGAQAVGAGAGTRGVTTAGLVLLVVARWLHFVGYALGFGTIAFGMWTAVALADRPAYTRHLWQLVHIGIVLLLCAEPLALLAQTIGVRGALFDLDVAGEVLASGFGLVWAQRVGLALLLWVLVGVVKDGAARALWVALALGLVLAVVDGAAGASGVRSAAISIAAATLHEVAMGAWIGGLVLLLLVWKELEREREALLARFGLLSAAAIGVLVTTGVVLAAIHIAQPAELFATFYGAVLVAKLLVALIAIGLAAFGRHMYREIWRWRAALMALIVVLGVAGLLVSVPSP